MDTANGFVVIALQLLIMLATVASAVLILRFTQIQKAHQLKQALVLELHILVMVALWELVKRVIS